MINNQNIKSTTLEFKFSRIATSVFLEIPKPKNAHIIINLLTAYFYSFTNIMGDLSIDFNES